MRDDDRYLDPKYNPFIPKGESGSGAARAFDDRAPFAPIERDPEKAGDLSELLEQAFPGGGIVELGGVKLVKLLGTWATEDGRRIEEIPREDAERIEKAIRAKEGT